MDIRKELTGDRLDMSVIGRLDTTTAPQLEAALRTAVNDVTELSFGFSELEYISSAGLRVLLAAQKVMNKQGTMIIHNANSDLMDIFEVTGFVDVLCIE